MLKYENVEKRHKYLRSNLIFAKDTFNTKTLTQALNTPGEIHSSGENEIRNKFLLINFNSGYVTNFCIHVDFAVQRAVRLLLCWGDINELSACLSLGYPTGYDTRHWIAQRVHKGQERWESEKKKFKLIKNE